MQKNREAFKNVLYADFFSVILENPDEREDAMPLPGGYCLVADDEKNCAGEWKMTIILYDPILKISFIQENILLRNCG